MCIWIFVIISYCMAAFFIGVTFVQFYVMNDVFTHTQQTFASYEYQEVVSALIATEFID